MKKKKRITIQERLLRLLIKEGLAEEGCGIVQIRAGHWQRSAGAANWYAVNSDGFEQGVLGFDTMKNCVKHGIHVDREVSRMSRDISVYAKDAVSK